MRSKSPKTAKQLNFDTTICDKTVGVNRHNISLCAPSGKTFVEAQAFCENLGARLPTRQELLNRQLYKSICGLKHDQFWTSTTCKTLNSRSNLYSRVTLKNFDKLKYKNEMCTDEKAKLGTLCVADIGKTIMYF